jgi:hypothetical protein
MGGQSPNVHRGAQISRRSPWPLGRTLILIRFAATFAISHQGGQAASVRYSTPKDGATRLYRGTKLALFGVSNGTPLFMGYEKMKGWAFERKQQRVAKLGRAWTTDDYKPVRVFSPLCVP